MPEPIDQRHLALDTEEFNGICYAYRTAQPDPVAAYHTLLLAIQTLIDAAVQKVSLNLLAASAPPPFKRDFRDRGESAFEENPDDANTFNNDIDSPDFNFYRHPR